ncbi:MAG TPA: hypothetical protein VFD39_15010 [Trueperaceae bacterium]|nr:hypothetical protein [Trueperaceae bacterium]
MSDDLDPKVAVPVAAQPAAENPAEGAAHRDTAAIEEGAVAAAGSLLAWRRQPFPVDWDAEFDVAGPLVLEIGFGDGRFTVRRALAEPGTRFVGLEVSSGSLQRALRRLQRAGIRNVRIAKVGAEFGLRQLFARAIVSAIVVNFPDPWPKEKHERHRLLKRSFFELAATRLAPGGEVRLATDHTAYLEFALREAAASGLFAATFPQPPEDVFETKYALKWREQGIDLNYVVFARSHQAPDGFAHIERPTEMPHSLLSGRLPTSAPLAKTVIAYGGGHVVLHEAAGVMVAEREHGDRWLIRATVEEPDLKQQLLVLVQQRRPDEVIVRLESFGDPVITHAVRGAVHAVTDWLEGNTDLSVKQRNY